MRRGLSASLVLASFVRQLNCRTCLPKNGVLKVLNKITLFGAIYLSVIAITPLIISACSKAEELTGISLGGTSIIIVVGVALETVRALEAQMLMRNYKGFLS